MSEETWPLEGIHLKTIIKITACNVFHNEGDNPHYQISIREPAVGEVVSVAA